MSTIKLELNTTISVNSLNGGFNMDNIGERVQYYRELSGLKKVELAKKVGVDPSQITKIENNSSNPALDTLFKICHALDVTPAEFFSFTREELTPEQKELLKQSKSLTKDQIDLLNKLLHSFQKDTDD